MEKVGMAICYAGIGCFYGALTWAVVKFTKAALDNAQAAEKTIEPEAEPEAVPAC